MFGSAIKVISNQDLLLFHLCSKWLHLRPLFFRLLHKEKYSKASINIIYRIWVTNDISKVYSIKPQHHCYYSSKFHVRYINQSKVFSNHEALKDKQSNMDIDKDKESEKNQLLIDSSKKLPLSTRIINELKHYYQGFRLLFLELKLSLGYILKKLKGQPLIRRERRQILRTTSDIIYLTPFLIVVLLPFGSLAIPFFVKLFPGLLPSTFKRQSADDSEINLRNKFTLKSEIAKYLRDTIIVTLLKQNDTKSDKIKKFISYLNRIRSNEEQTSNTEIIKFTSLFEDILTMNNFERKQLRALCKLLEISPIGPSVVLRFQLNMRMRRLAADDELILAEGVNSMETLELQEACEQRGMHSFNVADDCLKLQLDQWLDLHFNQKIPMSLLIFSRTFFFPDHF